MLFYTTLAGLVDRRWSDPELNLGMGIVAQWWVRYPFGFEMPQEAVLLFLPLGAIFNAIVALYTIPIAIGITAAIITRVKIN